jgi:hypothetical protein
MDGERTHQRARAIIGYDGAWDRASVIDENLLDAQSRELDEAACHPEHFRWSMWHALEARYRGGALDDTQFEALLALDTQEASLSHFHGIAHDLACRFALTDAQRACLADHPVGDERTRAVLLRKLATGR